MGPNRVLMVLDGLSAGGTGGTGWIGGTGGTGGTETHVLSLVEALRAHGDMPVYAGRPGALYREFARVGCPVHTIDMAGTRMNPAAAAAGMRALKRVMLLRSINVVHVHQTPSGIYAAKAANEVGAPIVFTAHDTSCGKQSLAKLAPFCSEFISVSKPIHAFLKEAAIESTVIPNGIDKGAFAPGSPLPIRRQLGIPARARVVVYAGRLVWDNAAVCTELIMAMRKLRAEALPDVRLVIVGGGSQLSSISRLVERVHEQAGQTFIHMTGVRTAVRDYYAAGDLVVGTGRVALEAMACGKPVLAAGNRGFFGFIEPSVFELAQELDFGDHGSLRKPTAEQLAQALRRMLNDEDALTRAAVAGQQWVKQSFDIGTVVARTRHVYAQARERYASERRKAGR